ncbi:MAG TPA: hypothetical protein VGH52_09255 [Gaiellaceae bacterium]
MIAAIRPTSWDFPLFLHLFGVMTLFGAVLTALVLAWAGRQHAAFTALLVALPAWVLSLAGGAWIESKEHLSNSNATWLSIGHGALEPGLIVLLAAVGVSFWWRRSGTPRLGQITVGLCSVYLLLLALAWLAMSGKWS